MNVPANFNLNSNRSRQVLLVALVLLISAAGCDRTPPGKAKVTGEVTWNGAPVKTGFVTFKQQEGSNSKSEAGKITDGKFAFLAAVG